MSGQNRVAVGNNQVDNQKRYSFCVDNKERLQAIQEIFFRDSEKESEEEEVEEEIEEKKDNTSAEEGKKVDQYLFWSTQRKTSTSTRNCPFGRGQKVPQTIQASAYTPPPLTGKAYLTRPCFKKGLPLQRAPDSDYYVNNHFAINLLNLMR